MVRLRRSAGLRGLMPLGFARSAGLVGGGGGGGINATWSGHTAEWQSGTYQFIKWNGSGNLTVTSNGAGLCDVIIVGGGAGARSSGTQPYGAGGGGSGNCRHLIGCNLPIGSHTITVGAGNSPPSHNNGGQSELSSQFNTGNGWSPGVGNQIIAYGGGIGAHWPYGGPNAAGTGGGGDGQYSTGGSGNNPALSPQVGFNGGNGSYQGNYGYYGGGGGGGSQGVGQPHPYYMTYMAGGTVSQGGQGRSYTSFRDSSGTTGQGYEYFAAGGGGYITPGWYGTTVGGSHYGSSPGSSGGAGTGSGGSGANNLAGGSGTIIIRWPL